MYYFIKDNMLHRYPVPERCGTHYDDEKLWDYTPHGAAECVYCLRRWPQDEW